MASPGLVAVGDVMVDVHVPLEALAQEQHVVGKVRVHAGGSAANAAAWANAAGVRAAVVGRVGNDLAGRALTSELKRRGIDARLTLDAEAPTGCVLALGERIIAERGATARLSPADLPSIIGAAAVLISGYILLQNDSEAAGLAALDRSRSHWLAVDAASARLLDGYGREAFLEATQRANVLLLNEDEAFSLTHEGPAQAVRELADTYRLICVKRGAAGAIASFEGALLHAEPPSIAPGEATGAGDAFAGALLAALVLGNPAEAALEAACRAGAAAAEATDPWPQG
ncbi:MAG TPA: PfkB family carbohydrate kinase [Gaiellaceae bacterium]|nr:PfkB family carbohydrate kinase [Gaiellaceae bacterium]